MKNPLVFDYFASCDQYKKKKKKMLGLMGQVISEESF